MRGFKMAGITTKIRELLDEGLSDREEITDRILTDTDPEELVEMVRPVVSWQVHMRLRAWARQEEKKAFPPQARSARGEAKPALTTTDELRNLVSQSFIWNENGERVTWGEATIEQHQSRARLLRLNAERSLDTANRHERAAQMIAEAGATCLSDLLDEPVRKQQRKKKAA